MKYLLLDTRNDKHYAGFTRYDVVGRTGRVLFDMEKRYIKIDGRPDGVSYSVDYTEHEMMHEMTDRAIRLLCRDYDFILYEQVVYP